MGSSSEPESRQAPGSAVLLGEYFVILGPFGVWRGTALGWKQEPGIPVLVLSQTPV